MNYIKRLLLSFVGLLPYFVMAQVDTSDIVRPVASAWEIGVGHTSIADTYLSPLQYDGMGIDLRYERRRAMSFNPDKWTMAFDASVGVDRALNPARNSLMWSGNIDLSWGMMHRWRLPHSVILAAGGSTSLDLGCIYSARNGNNPASAKAALTINLTGELSWSTLLAKRRLVLSYRPTIPITGLFFAPNYAEPYYEIYLGNADGLCHGAWWGNYFKMQNRVIADWYLSRTTALRIGYDGTIFSTRVNNITTQMISHSVVVGVSGEWLKFAHGGTCNENSRIISAIY